MKQGELRIHPVNLAVCLALVGTQVYAQTEGIEVIEVTAQKRVQNIQQVPIAINAFSAEQIDKLGAQSIDGLGGATPGMESNNVEVTQPNYTIRGIKTNDFGIGSDPAVAVYVDGVYIGRGGSAQLNFNDIQRVEILKGPQGTLFGRNAVAGAIHVITKQPEGELGANFRLSMGNYGKVKAQGMLNIPLDDNLFLRTSALVNDMDGYIDAADGGDLGAQNNKSFRSSLLWEANSATQVIWRGEFDVTDNDGSPAASTLSSISAADPYGAHATDIDAREKRNLLGLSMQVDHELSWASLTSITAWREFDSENLREEDGSDNRRFFFATRNQEENKQFSQEFRLTSNSQGPLSWVTGVNYAWEDAEQTHNVILTGSTVDTFMLLSAGMTPDMVTQVDEGTGIAGFMLTNFSDDLSLLSMMSGLDVMTLAGWIAAENIRKPWLEQTQNTGDYQSYSLYGDMTYALTDSLDLTLGARYTYDTKDFSIFSAYRNEISIPIDGVDGIPTGLAFFDQFDPKQEQDDSWSKLTPRVVLDYQASRDLLLYLSLTEGFKAGGFNSLGFDPAFEPEEVWNYEFGFKSSWLSQRLRINGSAFYWDYTDLQVLKLSGPDGEIPTYNIRNADAEGQGFELEMQWQVSDALTLTANYGYLDTEYTRYALFPGETDDLTGRPLSSMPKNKAFFAIDYSWPVSSGELDLRWDYRWVDDRLDRSGDDETRDIEGYGISNMRLSYLTANGQWQFALYANNLFDEEYLLRNGGQGSAIGSPVTRRGMPRTYGVEVSLLF